MKKHFIKTSFNQFINETHLTYDEIDMDSFTNNYLCGRWFRYEDEALEYLKSVIGNSNKTIDDYYINKNDKYASSKPYQIFPKPSNKDINRKEASLFIKKYGIIASPSTNYVRHPLYAYIEYKHIDKLKELGVRYKFKPITEIDLNGALSRFIKISGHTNTLFGDNVLKFYNTPYDMDIKYIKNFKKEVEDILNKFNNLLGSDYYIEKTFANKTDDTIRRQLRNKLDDKNYTSNVEFENKYKDVSFLLKRGNDENEFLAEVAMDSIDKPKML